MEEKESINKNLNEKLILEQENQKNLEIGKSSTPFHKHASQILDKLYLGDATSASLFGSQELKDRGLFYLRFS